MSPKSPKPKKRGRYSEPSRSLQQQLKSLAKKFTSDTNKAQRNLNSNPAPTMRDISEAELVHSILNCKKIDSASVDWSRIRVTAESVPGVIASKKHNRPEHDKKEIPLDTISKSNPDLPPPAPRESMPFDNPIAEDRCIDLAKHHWTGKTWENKSWNNRNIDPILLSAENPFDRPQLRPDQETLLRRLTPSTPTLNLRHLEQVEALQRLDRFVQQCQFQGYRIFRVITGKGILSQHHPVLKPALLRWCNDHYPKTVLRWTPEIDANGEYGGLLIELTRRG